MRRPAAFPAELVRQADLIPGMVPFSPATLWRKVKSKKFPAPFKLSAGITVWRRKDVNDWIETQAIDEKKKRTAK